MELKILKLIFDYATEGKLADSFFVNKIIEIFVSEKHLNNYVRNIQFTNKLRKDSKSITVAGYDPSTKSIAVDYASIQISLERKCSYYNLFSYLEFLVFKNLLIAQFILHELEHAYQFKQVDDKQDQSTETQLLRACFKLDLAMKNRKFSEAISTGEISENDFRIYRLYDKELYKQYYQLDPSEKLAQVKSFKTIVSALQQIQELVPNLYEFEIASLSEEMLKGYQDSLSYGACPTQVYLYGTRQEKVWKSLDFYDQDFNQLLRNVYNKYNLSKRLTLGLPVSYDEFNTTYQLLQNTNKFNF